MPPTEGARPVIDFILSRNESLARVRDTQWYRSTSAAHALLDDAATCPTPESFAGRLDVLSVLAETELIDQLPDLPTVSLQFSSELQNGAQAMALRFGTARLYMG